ncbi:hypothetical protein ACFZAV_08225 [Streptomyces sp. NPDC008343]|uniref:hypothetical protein n=1 Tax=Streptomyces sp. NPDC008343 TaxID=3364828 RepID=UPI0036E4E68D
MHRILPVLTAALVALPLLSGTPAQAATGAQRLSADSPFADCAPGALDPAAADGAIEPQLAVDPHDPRRLAVGWLQDRQRGVVLAVSGDRGRSWTRTVVPGLTRCSGGTYDYVDGPAVTSPGAGRCW